MKSFYKIITLALLVLGTFFVSNYVSAVDSQVEVLYEKQGQLIATVNIYGSKILSQKDNVFNISFKIANGEIAQPGVKYSVLLLKDTDKGQFVVDEKVYEEEINLSANTLVSKEITYIAPSNLEGKYLLYLQSKNDKGMTFSTYFINEIDLVAKKNGLNILNETCYLKVFEENKDVKYTLRQGLDILENENINLFCIVENKLNEPISVFPQFETFYRSLYGNKVEQLGGEMKEISFSTGEKKEISIMLPKATTPQAYDIRVNLSNDKIESNSVVAHYVLRGPSATIQNLSLDKDYYQKGEKIEISFLWSHSADSFPGTRHNSGNEVITYAEIDIVDRLGRSCLDKPLFKELSLDFSNPKILYYEDSKINCLDPEVKVSLVDSDGRIFDQKSFEFETYTKIPFKTNIKTIVLIIVLALALILFLLRKKKENKNSFMGSISLFLFIAVFSLGLFSFSEKVQADTFTIGSGAFYATVDVNWQGSIYYNHFEPTEQRRVSGSMSIANCGNEVEADLYSGLTYLINTPPTKESIIVGSALLPPDNNIGPNWQTFYASAKNIASKEIISGVISIPYYIVGPNGCCTRYAGCCNYNSTGSTTETETSYVWTCRATNYPGTSTYPNTSCSMEKIDADPVSCNYYWNGVTHPNNVYEGFIKTGPEVSSYCWKGTANNINQEIDGYGNKVVSYMCTGLSGKTVDCKYLIDPVRTQCYSGELNEKIYQDIIDCTGSDLCVDGSPKSCAYSPGYAYYWTCPTGSWGDYPLTHECQINYEDLGEYVLPSPECSYTNVGVCRYGESANLDTTGINYTWECRPIIGITKSSPTAYCSISKNKLIGVLDVNPKECIIPFWQWGDDKSCKVELSWSFLGPNATNTDGKVYLKNVTNGYSEIASKLASNGGGISWEINKDSKVALISTYADGNSLYSGVINIGGWNYIYDTEEVKLVKKENQKPVPFVEMKNGGEAKIFKDTSGQFVIWATDEDPIPNNNNHDVTFEIDWDSNPNTKNSQFVPPKNGSNFTFVAVEQKVDFSSSTAWANAVGTKCFNYKAFDYGDQAVGSAWKKFCVEILDPNATLGTISASPNPCFIQENQSICTTKLTLSVTNPVVGAQTNVTKPTKVEVVNNATINIFPKEVSGIEVSYPSTIFYLNHNGITLNSVEARAQCASGLIWNNTRCVANKPDLIAENIKASVAEDIIANAPTLFKADIKNDSSVNVNSLFYNNFKISQTPGTPSSWVAGSDNVSLSNLNGGVIKNIDGYVSFPGSGTWYVKACADVSSNIDEKNENNNCSNYVEVSVVAPPPAENTWEVDIKGEPSPLIDGRSATLTWSIERKTGEGGSCEISSVPVDVTLGLGGKLTTLTNGFRSITPRVLNPEINRTTVYTYTIECKGVTSGNNQTSITVVKLKEIEN